MLSPDSVHAYSEAEQLAAAAAVCSLAASHAANGRLVVAQGGTARLAGFILPRVAAVARIGGGGGGGGKDAARRGKDAALHALHALLQARGLGAEPAARRPAPAAPPDPAAAEALRRLVGGLPAAVDELLAPLVALALSGGRGARRASAPLAPARPPPRPSARGRWPRVTSFPPRPRRRAACGGGGAAARLADGGGAAHLVGRRGAAAPLPYRQG